MTEEKEELVKARLATRLRELKISAYEEYLDRIQTDRVELSNMVDVLTTNKTSFFREQHHFNREGIEATAMNPRIYEALACGALVISEWRSEIAERVPELPTFKTAEECVELVGSYLRDPDRLRETDRRTRRGDRVSRAPVRGRPTAGRSRAPPRGPRA